MTGDKMLQKKSKNKHKKSILNNYIFNKGINILLITITIICIIAAAKSLKNIFFWHKENVVTSIQLETIEKITNIEIIEDNEKTEIIEQKKEIPKANPYWDYIKMNLINVDFTELKKINSSTVGWIQVNGTNINYPFVQTKNNDYYLTHSFDKSYNKAGWVFLDYRNSKDFSNQNNILYAHSRLDKTMFGSLKNILKNGWLKNTKNHVIKLSTEKENTLWQVFSVYHIPETSDYIKTNFNNPEQFQNFANMLIERSAHNFNTTVNENDKILTLSTCYGETERMVVHAKLIKREKRN
jgi:sortase B